MTIRWTTDLTGIAPSRRVRDLLRRLDSAVWEGRISAGGHVQLRRRDGVGPLVTLPATPSDHRSLHNTRSLVRRVERISA